MEPAERAQLSTFLEEFADLIDGALTRHPDWFPDSLVEPLRDTWNTEIKPAIERTRSSITSGSFDAELEAEGLAGQQLQLKMAVWALAFGAADQPSAGQPSRGRLGRLMKWIGGALRPFNGALKIANAILESLGSAIPGIGAVKEFKDILEGSIDLEPPASSLRDRARTLIRRRFRRG